MAFSGTGKVWMNGKIVDWADANIHIASHVIHYGSAVFEGARCYKTPQGSAFFRLDAHMRRLYDSARIYRMDYSLDRDAFTRAVVDTVEANGLEACYIRPLIYRGYHALGVNPLPCPVDAAILVWEWGAYLGADALEQGVDVCVSSWTRSAPNTFPAMAKSVANYANSGLIKMEAVLDGLRRGHRARPDRAAQRRQRPEPVPRSRRDDLHAAGGRVGAAGHHARHGHHARAGPRHRRCASRTCRARCSTSPTRCSSSARPSRSRRFGRSTRSRSAPAAAVRSRPRFSRRSSTTSTASSPDRHDWLTPVEIPTTAEAATVAQRRRSSTYSPPASDDAVRRLMPMTGASEPPPRTARRPALDRYASATGRASRTTRLHRRRTVDELETRHRVDDRRRIARLADERASTTAASRRARPHGRRVKGRGRLPHRARARARGVDRATDPRSCVADARPRGRVGGDRPRPRRASGSRRRSDARRAPPAVPAPAAARLLGRCDRQGARDTD